MAKPTITLAEIGQDLLVARFEIPGGVCTPAEFAQATGEVQGQLSGPRAVLLNGRGPVWGYSMLVHAAHPTPAVGTYDPRLSGYVVVATHDSRYELGSVIPDPEAA